MRRLVGTHGMSGRPLWTPREDALMRELYPRGLRSAMDALPLRSREAVMARARFLGIHVSKPRKTDKQTAPVCTVPGWGFKV